jgi:hypothetical protein
MKFRIWWDVGFGRTVDDIEADNQADAVEQARMAAEEEAQNNLDYGAEECLGGNCGDSDDPEE